MGRETEGMGRESGEDVGGGGSDRPDKKMGRENARGRTHSTKENEVFFRRRGFLKVLGVREKRD